MNAPALGTSVYKKRNFKNETAKLGLTSADIDASLQYEEATAYADIVDYDLMSGEYNIFSGDSFISQQIQRS